MRSIEWPRLVDPRHSNVWRRFGTRAASVFALVLVACSAEAGDPSRDSVTALRAVPCTEGAACTCGSLVQGNQSCGKTGRDSVCRCDDGSTVPLDPGATESDRSTDGGRAPDATVSAPAGDDCTSASLGKLATRGVGKDSELLFSVELEGSSDTFKSSCSIADGPDLVQPIRADASGVLELVVESTSGLAGPPVLYLKATCDDAKDLVCDASGRRLELAVTAKRTYFLHVDTRAPYVPGPGARVTLRGIVR